MTKVKIALAAVPDLGLSSILTMVDGGNSYCLPFFYASDSEDLEEEAYAWLEDFTGLTKSWILLIKLTPNVFYGTVPSIFPVNHSLLQWQTLDEIFNTFNTSELNTLIEAVFSKKVDLCHQPLL